MLGLFVGYCYDLDYSLMVDIGVSVIMVIFLGINSVIKLVRCHRTGLFQCNHISLYGKGPNAVYCRASRRCLQRVKVMGVRYPNQVGRQKPCVSVVVRRLFVPVWDVYVLTTTVVVVSLVDTWPPRTSPKGSESEWPGECHGSRSVLSERCWSTRMGVRGHGFRGVGKVCYLYRV